MPSCLQKVLVTKEVFLTFPAISVSAKHQCLRVSLTQGNRKPDSEIKFSIFIKSTLFFLSLSELYVLSDLSKLKLSGSVSLRKRVEMYIFIANSV